MMIDLLHDTSLNTKLTQEGFCLLEQSNFLNAEFYSEYKSLVESIDIRVDELQPVGYYLSIMHGDVTLRSQINDLVLKHIDPLVHNAFTSAQVLTSSIIIKPAHTGQFTTHMNWSCTKRLDHSAFTLWIPLHDTTFENGTLKIFPRTHTFFNAPVPVNVRDQYFASFTEFINRHEQYKPIEVKKGNILCFDERIVHGSDINKTESPRVVLQVVITHKPDGTYFFLENDGWMEAYAVNREYFIQHGVLDALSGFKNSSLSYKEKSKNVSVTKAEFSDKLNSAYQES